MHSTLDVGRGYMRSYSYSLKSHARTALAATWHGRLQGAHS